jgi:hypothetical protein
LSPPRHVCTFFRDRDEEYAVLAPYTANQLRAGEQVLYFIDAKLRDFHLEQLQRRGIEVEDALRAGRLQLIPWQEVLLGDGGVDPDKAIARFEQLLQAGRSAGFPRSHLIVDMNWAFTNYPGVERLLEIENAANQLLLRSSDVGICVYHLERVSAELVIDVVRTHPVTIVDGIVEEHPFFTRPEEFLRAVRNRVGAERAAPRGLARHRPVDVAAIPAEELRACIRDLLATSVLPGSWRGRSFEQIVPALLEVMGALAPLEFAFAKVGTESGPKRVYLYRNGRIQPSIAATESTQKLEQLRAERRPSPIKNPFGEGTLTAVLLPLGIQGKWGAIIAASAVDGFPTATEQLLLGAAANQAVLALDETLARSLEEAKSRAEAEQLKATAELARLRTQFEPHFLLNALNTISGLVTSDPPQARRLLVYFGDLLRDSLRSNGDQETLGEQMDWLRGYAAILETRHASRLRFRWQVPDEAALATAGGECGKARSPSTRE